MKNYFQRNIDTLNELRSEHFKYTEYLNKGKYKLKQKFFGKGKKHYDFDINSQQYFHEEINDICFETSEAQEQFMNLVDSALNKPFESRISKNPGASSDDILQVFDKNPSDTRSSLARHFTNRINNLQYKRYLIMSRFHNSNSNDDLQFVQSRTTLIDKEIQVALSRKTRLMENDYFEESFVQGGKPVPVSETGQPIYKYLDQEECWYSNLSREDIMAYTRNIQHLRSILNEVYYPLESKMKNLVFEDAIALITEVEKHLSRNRKAISDRTTVLAENFNNLVEKGLQLISPGNLIEKENLSNFGYNIFGIADDRFLKVPLYPAIHSELAECFSSVTKPFFMDLVFKNRQEIISLLPKLNSFCQIVFKYQNKQILEGKKQIKLGLDDDIDVKKELNTMLEEMWVESHVKINFDRFEYKLELRTNDWPLDSISAAHNRENKRDKFKVPFDISIEELGKIVQFTDFQAFRKHMKKRAEKIVARASSKYFDMENTNHYNKKTNEEMTLSELSDLFRIKFNQQEFAKEPFLKPNAQKFLNQILEKHWINNPSEVEVMETINCLKIREDRVVLMNLLNGMRCYHRNLCLDLKVLSGKQFQFKLDDQYLINSNKQVIENFEKAVKDTATFFTKNSYENGEGKLEEDFILEKKYTRSEMYKKDIVRREYFGSEIPHVLVEFGKRRKTLILYNTALDDLKIVEERIMQNCTSAINQYERFIKVRGKEELVDRTELMKRIFGLETQYAFSKFKLIEKYYEIYANTAHLLDAFKVSKIIVDLIYRAPSVDSEDLLQSRLEDIYQLQVDSLQQEESLLEKTLQTLRKVEEEKIQTFHTRYSEAINVPLSAQVYLYRDLQRKEKGKSKLQRMNSLSSRMSSKSRSSKGAKKAKDNELMVRQLIREQFDEGDSDDESFDIQNYDEYLLRKDMDAIFDDMTQNDENKEHVQINNALMENVVVNPLFEGGPHPFNHVTQEVAVTSEVKQRMLHFYETFSYAANIRRIVEDLQEEFINNYGYVGRAYQHCLQRVALKKMNQIVLSKVKPAIDWCAAQSLNEYHERVTVASTHYEEIMAAALDPPSKIQMAIASTLEKHQEKLPNFGILSKFDYHSIESLICLRKPVNSAAYRQLALGVNFLSFLELRQAMLHIQLKRQRLIESYEKLAENCSSVLQRYGGMYSKSGQSEVFLALQEIKQYKDQQYAYSVLPEVLEELKVMVQCQKSDIQLFETIIRCSKIKLEDYILMKEQIGSDFQLSRFPNTRLLSNDAKTVKMIKGRIMAELSKAASGEFKKNTFFKVKEQLKIKVEKSIKQVQEADLSGKLTLPQEKMSNFCRSLLEDKLKRKLCFEIIDCYGRDLLDTEMKCRVFVETDRAVRKLTKLIKSSPYLSKFLHLAPEHENVEKSIIYDQKKKNSNAKRENSFINNSVVMFPNYIYSREQLIDEWSEQETLFRATHLNEFKIHSFPEFNPPNNKEELFKWIYKIPAMGYTDYQRAAITHFINFGVSFTGKTALSEFVQKGKETYSPPKNKFLTICNYYHHLLTYIQSNVLLIGLQMEDEIFPSFENIVRKEINFEEMYPINDEVAIHQGMDAAEKQYLKTCFNYKSVAQKDKDAVRDKFQKKGYIEKKEHWAVYDEILDFVVAKVQGRGVIRENFLPFFEELKDLLSSGEETEKILVTKVEQISHFLMLSTLEAYQNEQYQEQSSKKVDSSDCFSDYLFEIHRWFIGNRTESYRLQNEDISRLNLRKYVRSDELQELRYSNEIFHQGNRVKSITDRYRPILMLSGVDLEGFIASNLEQKININDSKKKDLNEEAGNCLLKCSDLQFVEVGLDLFQKMGEVNRLKLFTRMRYFFDKVKSYIAIKPKSHNKKTVKSNSEQMKLDYLKHLYRSKLMQISTALMNHKVEFPTHAKNFKPQSIELKEMMEINTYLIFDKFDEYRSENKIQFSKSQLELLSSPESIRKEGSNQQTYNSVLREVIGAKIVAEEFRYRALRASIEMLRNERTPVVESKKIVNTSLIPRVHLIASYSSPLVVERKTYISQQYKLAFAQAFINRFRNKVSRVDLLSSGYGFVITVPDLEDCVNFMNKLLFTFAEKQFKYRQQTHQQYFEIMVDGINEKNKVIEDQKSIIEYLKRKVQNITEAEYLGKVTKLLHEKVLIEDKLRAVEANTNGIEDRVRKTVEVQYEKKMAGLEAENKLLKQKFNEFKELFVILTKDEAKNNYISVVNSLQSQMSNLLGKSLDMRASFFDSDKSHSQNAGKFRESESIREENEFKYDSSDLQKCKLGEDIIHDPYYVTKLITKMRLFNLFKMGSRRIRQEENQIHKTNELNKLHKIQDTVISQSQRESVIRQELKKTQEELSKKVNELEKLRQNYESMDNERTKLKVLLTAKDKKIQQKERQALESVKKLQQMEKLPSVGLLESKVEKVEETPQVAEIKRAFKQKMMTKKLQKSVFLTNNYAESAMSPGTSVYDRFELSNKDVTWRQKCEDLYLENKRLLNELQKVKSGLTTPTRDGGGNSFDLRRRKRSESETISNQKYGNRQEQKKRFPNLSFKYSLTKQNTPTR